MVDLTPSEPQSAADYEDRVSRAVRSVLIEIGQLLGSYRGKFAVIGGAVPWLLLDDEEMPHVGTYDIDLSLDPEALADGEYADLVHALIGNGYHQKVGRKAFQLVREIGADDGGAPIEIVIDFLMPRNAVLRRNSPPFVAHFAVQKADGADLALRFHQLVALEGSMPEGGTNRVEIAVATIPALLAMKGYAISNRMKQKDAYDIYYCVRNYEGGPEVLAEACRDVLEAPSGREGFKRIAEKFETRESFGPTSVRRFVSGTRVLGDMTEEQWQTDAFEQVTALFRALARLPAVQTEAEANPS